MSEPVSEVIDYYLRHYPVAGDDFTADMVAEDAKTLAHELAKLRTALQNLLDASGYRPGCMCWKCLQAESAWTAADKLLKGGE